MLLDLPRDGDRVEVITSSKTSDEIQRMLGYPESSSTSTIQVSPLRQMAGILIDLIVMIKMKSGGSRTVNMQIECPNFKPKRIRIDGSWHSIV
ncbi:unnamed protein product [Haemonchus placei]|uniref:KH_dom_type_1 domain-containing protein n=1 Tax=Haemonchus placei TaxID=6290 RepID=A0A0N4X5Y6_HAEPC|nr:unnamed protein product [Haemonchus placei]